MQYCEKIKKIYQSDKFPILIYTAFYAIIHIFMVKGIDDLFFSSACSNTNLGDFLIQRYQTWTSRIIIEGILTIFCQYLPMIIWKIVNICMFYLLAYSISEIFIKNEKRKLNTIMCICLVAIPIDVFKEAGWMATMNNYLWVAATGAYSILTLKRLTDGERINIFQKIFWILCIIYASNQEQMAGILFIIYTIGIFKLIRNKKHNILIYINYLVIILMLILALTCPGNMNRKIEEEKNWYQGFSELSITTKLSNGILSMMDYVVESGRTIFFALIILIAYKICRENKNKFCKLIGCSSLILVIIFRYALRILNEPAHIELIQNSRLYIIAKILAYIMILVLIGIQLCIIFKKNKEKMIIANLIYFTGFISRFVMAFSPTVYASEERTSLFWYISIVMIIILIIQENSKEREIENGKI